MRPLEVKFLFEGVIFTSNVFVSSLSKSFDRIEFCINLLSRYLIAKYSESYFFVLKNRQFEPVYAYSEKEGELVASIQKALLACYELIEDMLLRDMQ
jgi:hypothetical protein